MSIFKKPLRPSTKILLLLAILPMIIISNLFFLWSSLKQFDQDAFAINNFGVVRGAIQRSVKLTLANQANEDVIELIEKTCKQVAQRYLKTAHNQKLLKHEAMHEKVVSLRNSWKRVHHLILKYRKTPSLSIQQELIRTSETTWALANEATYTAQHIQEEKLEGFYEEALSRSIITLSVLFIIMGLVIRLVKQGLERDVRYDPLTDLLNRQQLNEQLTFSISHAERYNRPFAVILLDIDFFKAKNDTYGHLEGDRILKVFSRILKENVRKSDRVFRYGGEEFAILVPELDKEMAKELADKIRCLIAEYDFGIPESITASFGVAEYTKGDTEHSIVGRADSMLYEAKRRGRNRVEVSLIYGL